MIVILNRDIKGTGKAGEIVKVSDGYARNMLLPRGYAAEATDGKIRNLEKQKALTASRKAEEREKAQKLADELKEKKVVIKSKAGEGGRLFGSVTAKDIADAAEDQLGIRLDKKRVRLAVPIKSLGRFYAEIKLYSEISVRLRVEVIN